MLGSTVLYYFYRLLEFRWPGSYFTASQYVDYAVSLTLPRYATFRLLPPYVVGVFVAATTFKYGGSALISVVILGVIHAAITVGRSLVANIRSKRFRRGQAGVDGAIAVCLGLIFIAVYYSYVYWLPVAPGLEKYVEVLLTGAVAAVVITQLQKFLSQGVDVERETRLLLERLPTSKKNTVYSAAASAGADRNLVLAVLVTELIQRRTWARRFESAGGMIGIAETFGAMQGSDDRADSERESAKKAIARLVTDVPFRTEYGHVPRQVLEYHLERHNQGSEFVELASEIFDVLESDVRSNSSEIGQDGTPAIRVNSCVRRGAFWNVTGDCSPEFTHIRVLVQQHHGAGRRSVPVTEHAPVADGLRRNWSAQVSLLIDRLEAEANLVDAGSSTKHSVSVQASIY